MKDLAQMVSEQSGKQVKISVNSSPNALVDKYIPSTRKVCKDLGVKQEVNLSSAIKNTILHILENRSFYNF